MLKSKLNKIISGSIATLLTLGTVTFFNGFNLVAANAESCNPTSVVTVPNIPIVPIIDPFVYVGQYNQAQSNAQSNSALNLSGTALNRYNRFMAQVNELLATTSTGSASSLTGQNLTKYNNLMAKINDLVGSSSTTTSKSTANAVINASNTTLSVGGVFDVMKNVKAVDNGGKGKDITNKITTTGSINTSVAGAYKITYSVIGANGKTVSKTVTVNVIPPAGPQKCTPNVPGSPCS